MAVDDHAAGVAIVVEERFPEPQQIVLALAVERPSRIDAGVHEQAPAIVIAQLQRPHPIKLRPRQVADIGDAVTAQRRRAAIAEPDRALRSAVGNAERPSFVIAP